MATVPAAPDTPFQNMALALSGGGFRAGAFHLGVLSVLHRLRLLDRVTVLSTVSGGTFTGAGYALALARGEDFPTFFRRFYAFLEANDLFRRAFHHLRTSTPDTPASSKCLIASVAQAYADTFFGDRLDRILAADTHLRELIINATEFTTGLSFRFQKSANDHAVFGNRNFPVPPEVARQVRLADVVAASSCFPGGFEPIRFPVDFNWPPDGRTGNRVPAGLPAQFQTPLPLMDGGIFDNQGIASVLLAARRTRGEVGLFIISDTDRVLNPLFAFPASLRPGWFTLRRVVWLAWLLFAVSCAAAGGLAWDLIVSVRQRGFHLLEDLFVHVIPLALPLGVIWVLLRLRHWLRTQILPRVPNVGVNIWQAVQNLSVSKAVDLVDVRLKSLYALAANVFMSRIRRLSYQNAYFDETYKEKTVANLIYELTPGRPHTKVPAWLLPSDAMQKVAADATAMATTLWFTKDTELPDLVACGQFTLCFNLLVYILRRYGDAPEAYPPAVREVFEQARRDWLELRTHPYQLLDAFRGAAPARDAGSQHPHTSS
jgi:predicted acylesterase/phospholipase RssA